MTPTQTVKPTAADRARCDCGCADCQGDCCKLECLARPNFFCGQLLTDNDLKAMVDWIEAKSALQRFRQGWGVACGLEVARGSKPKEQNRVYVSDGYAVDCCGRDIVVCNPIWYDFKCEKPFDPCCREPEPANNRETGATPVDVPKLGCIPLNELRAYELCLQFYEQMGGGQRAMVRGNCSPMDECQFTRVKETGKLVVREILSPCLEPPAQNTALGESAVEVKYRQHLKAFVDELLRHIGSARDLLDFVSGTLRTFSFVEECLCQLVEDERAGRRATGSTIDDQWIFYIIQDWRIHYFQCLCDSCTENVCEDAGVPLARVWVWNKQTGNCKTCKVVYVDSYPPYRRLLSRDCERCIPSYVDLSRYVWREVDEVKQELGKRGFTNVTTTAFEQKAAREVFTIPAKDVICAASGTPLTLKTYDDFCNRRRVVTFEGGATR